MSGLGSDGEVAEESAPKRQKQMGHYCINVIAYDEDGGDVLCEDETNGSSQLCNFCARHIGGGMWGH